MAAQGIVVTCTSSPQAVAGSIGSGAVHGYIRVRLKMIAGTGYLGDSGVTTAGYPLTTADAPIQEALLTGETLYIASSSGATASVAVLRMGETT
jgi:hypothetical protein